MGDKKKIKGGSVTTLRSSWNDGTAWRKHALRDAMCDARGQVHTHACSSKARWVDLGHKMVKKNFTRTSKYFYLFFFLMCCRYCFYVRKIIICKNKKLKKIFFVFVNFFVIFKNKLHKKKKKLKTIPLPICQL